jgi:hypothetical protein
MASTLFDDRVHPNRRADVESRANERADFGLGPGLRRADGDERARRFIGYTIVSFLRQIKILHVGGPFLDTSVL